MIKGHVPDCIFLLAVVPLLTHIIPDVQMEGDIIFNLEHTALCSLKYAVLSGTIPMLHQLTVQKAVGWRREGEKGKKEMGGCQSGGQTGYRVSDNSELELRHI